MHGWKRVRWSMNAFPLASTQKSIFYSTYSEKKKAILNAKDMYILKDFKENHHDNICMSKYATYTHAFSFSLCVVPRRKFYYRQHTFTRWHRSACIQNIYFFNQKSKSLCLWKPNVDEEYCGKLTTSHFTRSWLNFNSL